MPYRIAGIDVHKKKLAVVVADLELGGKNQFESRWYGSHPEQLRALAEWLLEQQVEEVVMESTAQYWKPVWGALERYWQPVRQKRETAGPKSGNPASCTSIVESRATRAKEGFRRLRTFDQAARIRGADFELCTQCRATPLAHRHPDKVPTHVS